MNKALPKTLLFQAEPEPLARQILTKVPELPLVTVDSHDAVPDALDAQKPEIVFAFKIGKSEPFPREAILCCDSVKWIQASGAGVDHWTPWDTNKVTITNASGIHAEVMAQYTLWAILNHRLGFPRMARNQSKSLWDKKLLVSAAGATLAVIGFGRIGVEVGRLAKAVGLKVIGVRAHPKPSEHADEVVGTDRLQDALGKADFVLNVLPLTEETRGLFNAEVIATMKPGACLINTGRGHIVEENALVAAIESGRLGAAVLDVFATEPLPPESPLWTLENVVITPHTAGDMVNWEDDVTDLFCNNLERWIKGETLANIVDPARGY